MNRSLGLPAIFAVPVILAGYWWLIARRDPTVLERPIAISRSSPDDHPVHLDSKRWSEIRIKFQPDRPFKSLPDLLHHIGNGFSDRLPDDPDYHSRKELLVSLLEGNLPERYEPDTPWLFRGIDDRPHITQGGSPGSEGHPSQMLAELAGLDIPSSKVVRSGVTSASIVDLVRSLREDFHLEGEIEWKAIALARYAPTKAAWTNRWGKTYDFDAIVAALLGKSLTQASCFGIHIIQSLVVIRCVDAVTPILSESSRDAIRRRMMTTIAQLRAGQRPEGYWAPDWFTPHPNVADYTQDHLLYTAADLALVTGHHLEWLDMLNGDSTLHDTDRHVALNWCVRALESVTAQSVAENLCAYSHCFRALTRNVPPNIWTRQRSVP